LEEFGLWGADPGEQQQYYQLIYNAVQQVSLSSAQTSLMVRIP
jgi:hypothetical protein